VSEATFKREWVEPPASTDDLDLAILAEAIRAESNVSGAWLAGSRMTTADGRVRDDLTIAFVAVDAAGTTGRPDVPELIEKFDPITSGIGLDVRAWTLIGRLDVARLIAPCGREIC